MEQRKVNGKIITIEGQDLINNTMTIKEKNGNTVICPMRSDAEGNFYFVYDGMGIYVSDYMGWFEM